MSRAVIGLDRILTFVVGLVLLGLVDPGSAWVTSGLASR